MNSVKAVIGGICISFPTMTFAQDCQSYIGQSVSLTSPQAIASALKNTNFDKGEFETTEAFEARMDDARKSLNSTNFVPIKLIDDYLVYDADTQTFRVGSWAFPSGLGMFSTVKNWDDKRGVNLGILDRVAVLVWEAEKTMGQYAASNAFGVSATVKEIEHRYIAIFERPSSLYDDEDLFGTEPRNARYILPDDVLTNGKGGRLVMSFQMDVEKAPATKLGLRGAVMIALKEPYYLHGTNRISPTIQGKRDILEDVDLIIADFKCAFVIDESATVLAATSTN